MHTFGKGDIDDDHANIGNEIEIGKWLKMVENEIMKTNDAKRKKMDDENAPM